jgi:hypothetical protein
MKPWKTISIVSVATVVLVGSSVGPVQLDGSASSSPHCATSEPSARRAAIWTVGRITPVVIDEIHVVSLELSGVSGLVSFSVEC